MIDEAADRRRQPVDIMVDGEICIIRLISAGTELSMFICGFDYLVLFGVPDNKWELLHGRVRWACPFLDRHVAKALFAEWLDSLRLKSSVLGSARLIHNSTRP